VPFGDRSSGGSWSLDVLTLDYLVSGQVDPGAQKWAWAYFAMTEQRTPSALEVTVSDTRSTGTMAAPVLAGKTVGFSYQTGLVGLIPRDEAAAKVWDKWADLGDAVAAEVTLGPYAISGSLLSPSGGLSFLINDRFAMRDATVTRVDGGSGGSIEAPQAVFSTRFVQTAALAAAAG
jgi:hypothetical protein